VTSPGTGALRTTVLLVEDSDSDAARLDVILSAAAPETFAVVRAPTVVDASSYLDRSATGCLVVDLSEHDAEGIEVVEALAARTPAVPLIVLTGDKGNELGVAALRAGASDHLDKRAAFEGDLLVRSVRSAVLKKRTESSLEEVERIAHIGTWEVDIATNDVRWSRELARLFAFVDGQQPSVEALLDRTHLHDRETVRQAVRGTLDGLGPFSTDHRVVLPDGGVRWVRAQGRATLDDEGRPDRLVASAQDITERRAAAAAILHREHHDPLSGLPNRKLVLDRLRQALTRLDHRQSTVSVICLDIDRFKVINDSLGFAVGDQVLLALVARLAGILRKDDVLARIGGDEFAVLCEGLADGAEAVRVADRICAAMGDPLVWASGELVISVSAGVAVANSSSATPASVLRDADAAMHLAKVEGRSRSAIFTETMRTEVIGRLDTEVALRQSIIDGDLRLQYQPIVNLVDGGVLGFEALVRWQHPTRGLLGPDHFIEIAEETSLILSLGAWVLQEACRQAKRFQSLDPRWSRLTMSINISGGQLDQPDLAELLDAALHDADLRPELVQLEMTEGILMDDAASTFAVLQALKEVGVSLGVDDFGTGYSSLAYLKRFPFDVLKIDRTFVRGLGDDPEDSAIVAAVVSLADALGLTVVAEGVETERQLEHLLALGCDRAQGYLFARPLDAGDAEAALVRAAGHPDGRALTLESRRPVVILPEAR
jgi:diguanylate cyclase (GGDEF)-like protein/PAS domain S-box-containing protein